MDGVENVNFEGLDIGDLREQGALGSDLCGEYWSDPFQSFTGGGNVFQNAPYMTGYTGNRAHGVMSDWSSFSLGGEVTVHDIVCDSGLVRGIGLYTHSDVVITDGATLNMNG